MLEVAKLGLLSFELVLDLSHGDLLLFKLGIQFLVLLCGHLELNSDFLCLLSMSFAIFVDLRDL